MYTVYVLKNSQGLLYKGYTGNLEERLITHNAGSRLKWTGIRGPWTLVYQEEVDTKIEALKREKFFKSGKGREFLKKIIGV